MGHLGLLKARLAKLKRELMTPKGGGGGPGEGFDVAKTGDARIGFVGEYRENYFSPFLKEITFINVLLNVHVGLCIFRYITLNKSY